MPYDMDEARYNRQNRRSPAEYPPGQQDDFMNDDMFFESGSGSAVNNDLDKLFSDGASNSFNSFDPNMGMNMMGGSNNTAPVKKQEDVFFESVGKILKETYTTTTNIFSSFSGLTSLFWYKFGLRALKVSVALLAVGILFAIFGWKKGLALSMGSCLSAAISTVIFMFNVENSRNIREEYSNEAGGVSEESELDSESFFDSMENGDENFDLGGDSSTSDDYEEEDSFDDYDDWGDFDNLESESTPPISTEDALSQMREIPLGMYTRQYLFDMFQSVLPCVTPNFAQVEEVDEDDDEFYDWEEMLREAGEVTGCNEDNLPELEEVKKTLFTVVLTCSRPKGFKPDMVASEIASLYVYRQSNPEIKEKIYAKTETVGKRCLITIFTGKNAMISIKDMTNTCKDWVLDSSNYIPIIIGIDQTGRVIKCDFKKVESIIITGMPRSGKSWLVQLILTQMCAYVSPKELWIYILDPKEGISDFKSFTLPHVKKFESNDTRIIDALRYVVKVEAPKRKKLIGDHGFVNIWDFKKVHPDIDLPIIYILVDEVVTLASRMDKEVNYEFRMLLRELISQLPALGIRAILIPHILNNDIIEKKTSDLVPFKVSVMGDADHIEKATGSKFKEFPYRLTNQGDNAVKLNVVSSNTMFVHSAVLTTDNVESAKLFDYMRRVWKKLEPNSVRGSVAESAEDNAVNINLLRELESSDNSDLFSFEEDEVVDKGNGVWFLE